MATRKEKDSIGYIEVPAERYWGAQTQRSRQNFKIGGHQMPIEIIHAFAILKKSAATINNIFCLILSGMVSCWAKDRTGFIG